MHTWNWQTYDQRSYLTCSLLDPWPHGFFTRAFSPMPPAQLAPILAPQAQAFRVKQVHGNQVLGTEAAYIDRLPQLMEADNIAPDNMDADSLPTQFPEADGLITQGPHQAIWVCTADCTPVLMADSRLGQVAAVHAGWRGTAAKIAPIALAQLQAQGSQLQDIRVAMGPAIAGEVYQVTTEVAAQVGQTLSHPLSHEPTGAVQSPDAMVQQLLSVANSPLLADPEPGRVRLDVRRVNAIQLEQLGLLPEQIAIAPHCTYQEPEKFFSYRREHRKQVQWSGIVSR